MCLTKPSTANEINKQNMEKRKFPKIIFKYSRIYDQIWRNVGNSCFDKKIYLKEEEIQEYLRQVENLWKEKEEEVFKEIFEAVPVNWEEKDIICYVVGKCFPIPAFSDPLTISLYENKNDFIDTLVHEIIHHINVKIDMGRFKEKYKDEPHKTIIHISVYAIHTHVYLRIFGKERLERNIKRMKKVPGYGRAWEIVEREGYENILNEIRQNF